jgi:hypothetical protein
MAKKHQVQLKVIECRGDYGSIHKVPSSTIELMRKKWQTLVDVDPNDQSVYCSEGFVNE